MYQVQYLCKGQWVNWAQAPTPKIAMQYASTLVNRYTTRFYKIDGNA